MRRTLAAAMLLALSAPLGGCALTYQALARPENKTCELDAFTGLIDVGATAVGALVIGSDNVDNTTGAYVADGVLAASALVGLGSALVCKHRAEDRRDEAAKQEHPIVYDRIPDSMRLHPADPEVRDATPDEMGLAPTPASAPPDLAVHTAPPAPEKKPPPPPPMALPLPKCQLSPRIDCPEKTECELEEENRGTCVPLL